MSTLQSFGSFAPLIGRDIDDEWALAREAEATVEEATRERSRMPGVPTSPPSPVKREWPTFPPAVQLEQVSKRYGTRRVLDAFDFTVERGSFVAIVGRSGCGKSTLLRLIAGLDAPDAGTLATHGTDGPALTRIMFQDARLLPWKTVLANVMLGLPPRRRDDALAVLAEVGLAARAGDWPAQLSGGERQRVALARALVHRPQLLLLDEPLGALDALTRIEMHALIERLWREHEFTAVLVTHDVQEAVALADRIVLIDDGRIALDAPVPLERPRKRGNATFGALEANVLSHVMRTRGAGGA